MVAELLHDGRMADVNLYGAFRLDVTGERSNSGAAGAAGGTRQSAGPNAYFPAAVRACALLDPMRCILRRRRALLRRSSASTSSSRAWCERPKCSCGRRAGVWPG